MSNEILKYISPAQQKRLTYIDFRANFLGSIARSDLISRYGIKEAASTRDITEYRQLAPENLNYDKTRKIYTRSDNFKPLFNYSANQVLTALSEGFGEDYIGEQKAMIACDTPSQLNKPSLEVLAVLSRAIYQNKAVHITYCSVDSGEGAREIVPFALVDNGLRWHVRAFDRKRSRFMDCVITRISDPIILDSPIEEFETREYDIQWNRIVELEIVAHPKLLHPETIELDYGMKDGVLNVNIRAAMAGYLLRLWNIDCTDDHRLEGNEFHLWLRNNAALYRVDKVDSLVLTPGYKTDKETLE